MADDKLSNYPKIRLQDLQEPTLFRFNSVLAQVFEEIISLRLQQQGTSKEIATAVAAATTAVRRSRPMAAETLGDVLPIGGDPFLVTVVNLPGGDIALDIEYDPPSPIGDFAGVYGVAVIPSAGPDATVVFPGYSQYNGDKDAVGAARHGTLRFVFPDPGADQEWRIALVSYALDRDKKYVPWDAVLDAPSPNKLVDVGSAGVLGPAPDPIGPTACALAVNESGDDFGFTTSWTPAAPYGGAVGYEREVCYYSDADCLTPISDWIALGNVWGGAETTRDAGWWPKPTIAEYVKLRVRAYNSQGKLAAWVESVAPFPQVPISGGAPIPAPSNPTDPVVVVLDGGARYGLRTSWTNPVDMGSTTGFDREACFFSDDGALTPESDWIVLGPVGNDVESMDTDFWPRPDTANYVQFRIRAFNGLDTKGAWVYSATPLPIVEVAPKPNTPLANNSTLETKDVGGIPSFRFHLLVAGDGPSDGFAAQARFFSDNVCTIPNSEWIDLGWIDSLGALDTDWWPLDSAPEYAIVRIAAQSLTTGLGNWLNSAVLEKPASGGLLNPPGPVILGTPKASWELIEGVWNQVYSVPVTPPVVLNGFDRLFVGLRAPDDVGVQKATISNEPSGFIIDADPAAGSKVMNLAEPLQTTEVPWNPNEAVVRVTHAAPVAAEKWRIIVISGSPIGRGASASVVVDAAPPDPSILKGKPGKETSEPVSAFTGTPSYQVDKTTGEKTLKIDCTWAKPTDIRYGGIIIYCYRSDYASLGYRAFTGVCGDTSAKLDVNPLPTAQITLKLRAIQVDINNNPSSYAEGITPEVSLTIDPPAPASTVTGLTATPSYQVDSVTGEKTLKIDTSWAKPSDPSFGGVILYVYRSDYAGLGYRAFTGVCGGTSAKLDVNPLPTVQITVTIRAIQVDVNNVEIAYSAGVTPETTLTIDPPKTASPLQNASAFSMAYVYLAPDYYGSEALRFTPTFTLPNDPSLAYFELWGKKGTGDWTIRGYPSSDGVASAVIVKEIPTATETWQFALVSFDVNGRNKDGAVTTTAGAWPSGTPTCSVNVDPPTGKMDGGKIANIPAAAFAAGLTATYLGTALPALPSATYPPGTPFILAPGGGVVPKIYRVNAAGNAWTAEVNGADLVARTVYGGSVVAGAIGTYELSTTEILVGPGGNRPIRFVVRDLSSTLLCMIGDDSGIPFTGAYFRSLKIAPGVLDTDHCIVADGTGVVMTGVNMTTHPAGSIAATGYVRIGPAYYDPIYSFPAVVTASNAADGSFAAVMGRGIVCTNTSGAGPLGQVAALVRDPGNVAGGQMVLYGPSYLTTGNYILANGTAGTVRADNGYQCGGYVGLGTRATPVSYNVLILGGGSVTLRFVGGILC